MLWDLFCRVIDNWGDIGVCWRLAADLRARGHRVRLWVDDPSALRWMATDATDVSVWNTHTTWPDPGDVVIEAFGCELPSAFVERMAARAMPPRWINLEYLTAEPYALRSHGLRSPQQGAGSGLSKYFFYPGWVEGSGGLLREQDLAQRQARFSPAQWLAQHGLTPDEHEQTVSLFCYRNNALPALLDALQASKTLLLVTAGLASDQVRAWMQGHTRTGGLRVAYLPPLTQRDFDHLLWASDVNLVRGEDSFVRAQWANRPFVWQIYPQDDGAHIAKLEAFHQMLTQGAGVNPEQQALNRAWNSLGDARAPFPWPEDWGPWKAHSATWGALARTQADLTSQLIAFVDSHTSAGQR